MKTVSMFQAVDGKLFTSKEECKAHDEDCIGEEFDALLLEAISATNGYVTRNSQFQMCLHLLKNKEKVLPILKNLVAFIEGEQEEEQEDY